MAVELTINGRLVRLEAALPLPRYLESLGVDLRAVAVEVDGRILGVDEKVVHILDSGQVVEIVRMVGGGRSNLNPMSSTGGEDAGADRDPTAAAEAATDVSRRLPGEPVDADLAADAQHWAQVYLELLIFKRRALENVLQDLPAMSGEARNEVESTDVPVLRSEAERFERRHAYWRRRYEDLSGG